MDEAKKKIIFSAIQPTGIPTLGNYLGALKNWKKLLNEYHCVYSVADLHSITVRQDPKSFKNQILDMYALLIACGIEPEQCTLFIQSHVHQHAELSWILSCYTQFGELSRMTQFKDKSQKNQDNVNAGLFTYPSLMAADILLYQTDLVPVGIDQKQHLEIARDIAIRFNSIYGNTFKVPDGYINEFGAKIMSLAEPTKKMSKSDDNSKSYISILDSKDTIIKKCKSAVTDSEALVRYAAGKDGINNLITIYSCVTDKKIDEIEKEFNNCGYGDFKVAVGEAVADHLAPVLAEFNRVRKDTAYLTEVYTAGAKKAEHFANRTLEKVMKKVGFVAK